MIDLTVCASRLLASGKGILAADESIESADKRLAAYGIGTGPEMRQQYRELFLGMPGIEEFISGVILNVETLDQALSDGTLFTDALKAHHILPGIKVDEGLEPLAESPKESITKGLLSLSDRLFVYKTRHGATFTKWRATITIDGTALPTRQALHENMKRLASYAHLVQAAGMVPILEPEILMQGKHSRVRAREVLTETINLLIASLSDQAVDVSAVVLKTAMVISGSESGRMDTPGEVAADTVAALMEAVPRTMGGIVFLSGGQTPDQATRNLAAIMKEAKKAGAPWPITYSYARALQDEALKAWQGKPENVPAAREAFRARLVQVTEALAG